MAKRKKTKVEVPRPDLYPAGWRFTPDDLDKIVESLHSMFNFAFDIAPKLSDEEWNDPRLVKQNAGIFEGTLRTIRALSLCAEARGINSTPLADVGARWVALCRQYPTPREAFLHMREVLDDAFLMQAMGATTQVLIEGMEPVADDLWARNYLRKSRRAVRCDDDVEMCECGHAADDHDRRGDNACPCGNEVIS